MSTRKRNGKNQTVRATAEDITEHSRRHQEDCTQDELLHECLRQLKTESEEEQEEELSWTTKSLLSIDRASGTHQEILSAARKGQPKA